MTSGPLLAEGRTAEVFAWGDDQVLKLIRRGFSPELADREAQIVHAVHEAGVSCPSALDLVEVDGRRGIVFERVEGPSVFEIMMSQPRTVDGWARSLAELHAGMHAASAPHLPSLRDRLENRVRSAPGLRGRARRALAAALDALPDGDAICHGDFHPGNVHATSKGPVVIDWVDAARGPPLADVARTELLARVGKPPLDPDTLVRFNSLRLPFLDKYLDRYFDVRPGSPEALHAWLPIVAAARLNERISGERRELKRMIRQGL